MNWWTKLRHVVAWAHEPKPVICTDEFDALVRRVEDLERPNEAPRTFPPTIGLTTEEQRI